MYLIGSSLSVLFGVNWNLEMLVFEERGKPECPEENLSQKQQTPLTFDAESGNRIRATLVRGLHGRQMLNHRTIPAPLEYNRELKHRRF